jgi:putative sugar O-methyltransferase
VLLLISICKDQLNRLVLKVHRLVVLNAGTKSNNQSDSENTKYVEGIKRILNSDKKFQGFRKSFRYREILEHVSFYQGFNYLQVMKRRHINVGALLECAKKNDAIGRPVTFRYKNFGIASPTTLRYLKVAADIEELFGSKFDTVVEIGAGYGGQASILFERVDIKSYYIYDLPEAQNLIRRYLQAHPAQNEVEMLPIGKVETQSFDLVISNYAFSELPIEIQREYCEKILSNCHSGYLTMNSGYSNITGRSDSKMKLAEILSYLPTPNVYSEDPQTGPDNYMIVWGNASHSDFQRMNVNQ